MPDSHGERKTENYWIKTWCICSGSAGELQLTLPEETKCLLWNWMLTRACTPLLISLQGSGVFEGFKTNLADDAYVHYWEMPSLLNACQSDVRGRQLCHIRAFSDKDSLLFCDKGSVPVRGFWQAEVQQVKPS